MAIVFVAGIGVGHYKLFPFSLMQKVYSFVFNQNEPRFSSHYINRVNYFDYHSENEAETDIAFVGDSHIELYPWSESLIDHKIINRGIGGDTTFGVIQRLDSILARKPKFIVLLVGVNDIMREVNQSRILKNYQELIDRISNRGTKVILIEVPLTLSKSPEVNSKIMALNKAVRYQFSNIDLVSYISINEELSEGNTLKRDYTFDGVHLNAYGYDFVVEKIKAYL